MAKPVTFVVIPTFRETEKIVSLLHCFNKIKDDSLGILIVNGDPDDETSAYLSQHKDRRVHELPGDPKLYWSGSVNIGLRYVLHSNTICDFIIMMNADIVFDCDSLPSLIAKARSTPHAQLGTVNVSSDRILSSGVKVTSWIWTLNQHPLAGTLLKDLSADLLIPVDFLPTRCTLIPFEAIKTAGLIAESKLPHYGGDYEYTNRLRRLGCPAFIYTGSQVRVDTGNTGANVFHKKLPMTRRLRAMFSIKSISNPVYRLRFVRLVYPWYAVPTAMLLYAVRSVLEVLLGGRVIKCIFRRRQTGFSGSSCQDEY